MKLFRTRVRNLYFSSTKRIDEYGKKREKRYANRGNWFWLKRGND